MKERIKQIRLKLGMQQGEFAGKTGIIQQQLSKYERGENRPSSEFLTVLVEKFDVNINWLLTGKGEMFAGKSVDNNTGIIEIPILASVKDDKNSKTKCIYLDIEMLKNIVGTDYKNLRAVEMPGENLKDVYSGFYANNKDILLIDISENNFPDFGIYVYTVKNSDKLFVNIIQPLPDGSVGFNNSDKNYPNMIYSRYETEKMEVKILGKVLKNLTV